MRPSSCWRAPSTVTSASCQGHVPLLGVLAEDGEVIIRTGTGSDVTAKVSGGFLSVTNEGVSVLAERADLA